MANEFKHKVVGGDLDQNEWEGTDTHIADGQVAGDVMFFDGTSWRRTNIMQLSVALSTITILDAINIPVGTTTGTKIGTNVAQKLGFWAKTPITQPAGSGQAALTNSTGGTGDGTLSAVSGSGADATINNNFTELHVLLDAIRTALVNAGLIKGSA